MIDAMLGIVLGSVFVTGAYGVWTWQSFSRKMREYNELADDNDALFEWWLKAHRENIELRQKYELWEGGDAHGDPRSSDAPHPRSVRPPVTPGALNVPTPPDADLRERLQIGDDEGEV